MIRNLLAANPITWIAPVAVVAIVLAVVVGWHEIVASVLHVIAGWL